MTELNAFQCLNHVRISNVFSVRADAMDTQTIAVEYGSFRVNEYLNYMNQFCNVLLFTVIRDPIGRAWSDLNYDGSWHCDTDDTLQCAQENLFWIRSVMLTVQDML